MRVEERAKDHVASTRGEYWRLLTPGVPYMMWALIRKKIMTFEQVFTPFGLTMRIGAA